MSIVVPGLQVQTTTTGAGLSARRSVQAASTTNIATLSTLSNGGTLDGYALQTNDRILLKNQTTGTENGIYIVQVSGAPIRAEDYTIGTAVSNTFMTVQHGTVNDDTVWLCTNDPGSDVVGTNALSYVFFGGDNIASLAGLATAGSLLKFVISEDIPGGRTISPGNTNPGPSRWVLVDGATPQELTPTVTSTYSITQGHSLSLNNSNALLEFALFRNGTDFTVASKTQANPMVITTTTTHTIVAGEDARLIGLSGVTDGRYLVTAVTGNTLTVEYNNSAGNTTGGGTVRQAVIINDTTYKVAGNTARFNVTLTPVDVLTAGVTYFTQVRLSNTNNATAVMYINVLRFITTSS